MNIYEVKYSLWSMKIGEFGGIVQGLDDIHQMFNTVIKTRKGTVPLHPDFGCDAWKFIDSPIDIAKPNIVREVIDSVTVWIPIVEILETKVEISNLSNLVIANYWTLKDSDEVNSTEVIYELARA